MCISLCVFAHWLGLSGNHFSKESQILSPELGQTESVQKGAWNTLGHAFAPESVSQKHGLC